MLETNCELCNLEIKITPNRLRRTNHNFCSYSCSKEHRLYNDDRKNHPKRPWKKAVYERRFLRDV